MPTGGEDWFEVCLYVDWGAAWPKLSEKLLWGKGAAADYELKSHSQDLLCFGEYQVQMRASGAALGKKGKGMYMAYVMDMQGLVIQIANRACFRYPVPNVVIRIDGLSCLRMGALPALELGRKFIMAMGGKINQEKLTRVDMCLDMPGVKMDDFVAAYREKRFVCRANDIRYYEGKGISLYFGKCPMQLRIYDKKEEIAAGGDYLKRWFMIERRWRGVIPEHAIRVEFEMGREALKDRGIDSPEDYFRKRADLISYLCGEWMRFTTHPVDRQNTSRADVLPLWEDVKAGFKAWAGLPCGVPLEPLDRSQVDVAQLVKQAIGVMLTVAAIQGIPLADLSQFVSFVMRNFNHHARELDIIMAMARRMAEMG